jgi:hypothetical protein
MTEVAERLYGGELLLIFLMKGKIQPAGADAVIRQVPEGRGISGMDDNLLAHMLPPFQSVCFIRSVYCPGRDFTRFVWTNYKSPGKNAGR